MAKFKLILLLVLVTASFHVSAQDSTVVGKTWKDDIKKTTVKLNPSYFFGHTFLASFEKVIKNNHSIQINIGITAYKKNQNYYSSNYNYGTTYNSTNIESSLIGGSGEIQYRSYVFPRKRNMHGFYFSPYLKYQYLKAQEPYTLYSGNNPNYPYNGSSTTSINNYTISTTSGGFILGYQFLFGNVLSLDLFLGGGIKVTDSTNKLNNTDFRSGPFRYFDTNTGIAPKIGFTIGVAF